MIKNLNLVVTQDASGKIKVAHVGDDRRKALEQFEKAAANDKLECVVYVRNPSHSRRKFPARAARIKEERIAANKAAEAAAEAEIEEQAEEEDAPAEDPAPAAEAADEQI